MFSAMHFSHNRNKQKSHSKMTCSPECSSIAKYRRYAAYLFDQEDYAASDYVHSRSLT